MQGLTFSAAQARLVVDGKLDVTRRPIQKLLGASPSLRPDTIARFVQIGRGRIWAALDETGFLLGTMLAPVVDGETVYVAEPWTLRDGAILYEADEPRDIFWAPPHIMPPTSSRARLFVTNVRPERLQQVTGADVLRAGAWRPEPAPAPPAAGPGIKGACVDLDYLHNRFAAFWDAQYQGEPGCSWSDNPWVWRIEFTIHHQHQEEKKAHA